MTSEAQAQQNQIYISKGTRKEICQADTSYPQMLFNIEEPPKRLYVVGDANAIKPGLAIVGARKATPYGLECARRFASIAAQMGVTVISGGAIGCDQAAHKGALEANGNTIVVLGCGADVIYPRRGKQLFEQIIDAGGALVSEVPWGTPPLRWAFRKRNRIIAGLAKAVLIVEAGLPSGTFSTADYALDAGRDVLAVPGAIFSKESFGSNKLIADGAVPIIDDEALVQALLKIFSASESRSGNLIQTQHLPLDVNEQQLRIISMLAACPMSPDQIVGDLQCDMQVDLVTVLREISLLEALGVAQRFPDGRFGVVQSVGYTNFNDSDENEGQIG